MFFNFVVGCRSCRVVLLIEREFFDEMTGQNTNNATVREVEITVTFEHESNLHVRVGP